MDECRSIISKIEVILVAHLLNQLGNVGQLPLQSRHDDNFPGPYKRHKIANMILHDPSIGPQPVPSNSHAHKHQIHIKLTLLHVGHQLIGKHEVRLLVPQPQQGHSCCGIEVGRDGLDQRVGCGDG